MDKEFFDSFSHIDAKPETDKASIALYGILLYYLIPDSRP